MKKLELNFGGNSYCLLKIITSTVLSLDIFDIFVFFCTVWYSRAVQFFYL